MELTENTEVGEIIHTPPGPTAISFFVIVALIIQLGGDLFQKNKRTITKYYQKTRKLIDRAKVVTHQLLCHSNMGNMYDFCKKTGFWLKSQVVKTLWQQITNAARTGRKR